MSDIDDQKSNTFYSKAKEYCQGMLQVNMNHVKGIAGEDITKEINRLKVMKSRDLKPFLSDAIDAILLIHSSITYPNAVFEPPYDVWKEFFRHLGAPERAETDEERNQAQECSNKANELVKQFLVEYTNDMDRFIKDIFTPERIQRFAHGMFPYDDRQEDKKYRILIAKILLEASASYLIKQVDWNYRSLLEADMRKAIQIAHVIATDVGVSEYGRIGART